MTELLSILTLCLPTVWEIYNDRHGDLNKSSDVIWRIVIGLLAALAVSHLNLIRFVIAFNLSMAINFLLFDYLIAYILIRNGTLEPPKGVKYHWWSYIAKSGFVDNVPFWIKLNLWVKLAIRVVYFGISLLLYLI